MSMHVKKGDKVKVIAGKDKGSSGVILKAIPKENKVVVEGINRVGAHHPPRFGDLSDFRHVKSCAIVADRHPFTSS